MSGRRNRRRVMYNEVNLSLFPERQTVFPVRSSSVRSITRMAYLIVPGTIGWMNSPPYVAVVCARRMFVVVMLDYMISNTPLRRLCTAGTKFVSLYSSCSLHNRPWLACGKPIKNSFSVGFPLVGIDGDWKPPDTHQSRTAVRRINVTWSGFVHNWQPTCTLWV